MTFIKTGIDFSLCLEDKWSSVECCHHFLHFRQYLNLERGCDVSKTWLALNCQVSTTQKAKSVSGIYMQNTILNVFKHLLSRSNVLAEKGFS